MRSLPLEDSRTASDSKPLHDENTSSTQHGLQENDIRASSDFPSQGMSETSNTVLHGLEDASPFDGTATFTPENNEREHPNLREHSQVTTDRVTEHVSVTASSPKVVSDGPQFKVLRRDGKSDGSPIATLPNGTLCCPSVYSWYNDI